MTIRTDLGEGAWVELFPTLLLDHLKLLDKLAEELPLAPQSLFIFGQHRQTPRLCSWHGDPGCSYAYSGKRFEPNAWTPTLTHIREAVSEAAGIRFNSVLANYYRDGSDSMARHSDNEPELGPSPEDIRIASLSLGDARTFRLRHKESRERHDYRLGQGDLLVMGGHCQEFFDHEVPKTKRAVGARLNLTFRLVGVDREV